MSLGGIAVSIGAMVDAVIILIDNVHEKAKELKEELRLCLSFEGRATPLFAILFHYCRH